MRHCVSKHIFVSITVQNINPSLVWRFTWSSLSIIGIATSSALCGGHLKVSSLKQDDLNFTGAYQTAFAAVIWLQYCRYGVKHYPINQSIKLLFVLKLFVMIPWTMKTSTGILCQEAGLYTGTKDRKSRSHGNIDLRVPLVCLYGSLRIFFEVKKMVSQIRMKRS